MYEIMRINFLWKLYVFFLALQIRKTDSEGLLDRKCYLSNGKEGYCRIRDDCFGISEETGCGSELSCCENSGKADEKCGEYKKYVYHKSYGAVLMASKRVYKESDCNREATPLIVGGLKAKKKEFPHMAVIGYGATIDSARWICGGSLISENFILTAAHCFESKENGPAKFVRLGLINIKTPDISILQQFDIAKRIVHPRYKPPSRYYDIALFKLSNPVKINGHVRPACLNFAPEEDSLTFPIATGWGKLNYDEVEGSSELMKVTLSVIDSSKCNASFEADVGGRSLRKGIIPSQICAGELKGGKDTCQGDSGGPLQIIFPENSCMYKIIGVTSFGKFCGFKNSPAVYTRVFYFIPWIESIVWP